jgi:hypothetical protein
MLDRIDLHPGLKKTHSSVPDCGPIRMRSIASCTARSWAQGVECFICCSLACCQTKQMKLKMLFNYIIAHPAQVAFDDHETIFGTFARGLVPGVSTSTKHDERSLMCWDGVCAIDQKRRRGISCTTSSGSLALYDNSTGRIARPLMWHVNGPSLAFLKRHPSCAKSAYNAKGWTWSSFSR